MKKIFSKNRRTKKPQPDGTAVFLPDDGVWPVIVRQQ